jgi:hemerythrin-like domain-containing protein
MLPGVQIGAAPEAGWDDPIGLMTDCHRRIEMFLGILVRVAAMDPARPLSEEGSTALRAALHYFRTSGLVHNADEEESLFPRLVTVPEIDAEILIEMKLLEAEHRQAAESHAIIEELATRWTQEPLIPAVHQRLLQTAAEMRELYLRHIRVEESKVFPAARKLLPAAEIAHIGKELRAHRA